MPKYKCFNCLRTFNFERPRTSKRCPQCSDNKLRALSYEPPQQTFTLPRVQQPSPPKALKPSRVKPKPVKRKRETLTETEKKTPSPKKRRLMVPFDSAKSLGTIPCASWTASSGPLGLVTWNVAHLGKLQPLVIRHFREACWWYQRDETQTQELQAFLADDLVKKFKLEQETASNFVTLILRWFPPLQGTRPKEVPKQLRNKLRSLMAKKKNLIHRLQVLQSSVELFSLNPWLHLLVLQEVNLGSEHLLEVAKTAQIEIHLGPMLQSHKSADDEEDDEEDDELGEEKKGGVQYEYYPLLMRKDSGLQYKTCYAIATDGSKYTGSGPYLWDKHQRNYRPVVVHVLQWGSAKIHVGVIHTTPGAGVSEYEFSRSEEYKQILASLNKAAEKSSPDSLWVLCGDFYLTREAQVTDAESLTQEQLQWGLIRNSAPGKKEQEKLKKEPLKKLLSRHEEAVKEERANLQVPFNQLKTKVTQGDLLRNLFTSFERQLDPKLAIAQTVHGTNWHGKALAGPIPEEKEKRAEFFATARIADFFIYSRNELTCSAVGLVRPEGGLALSDSEDLEISRFWRSVSDHFPAGCLLAKGSEQTWELQVHQVLAAQKAPEEQWEEFESRRLFHKTVVELLALQNQDESTRLPWLKGKSDSELEDYLLQQEEGLVFRASHQAQRALGPSSWTSPFDFFPSQQSSRPSWFTPAPNPPVFSNTPPQEGENLESDETMDDHMDDHNS